MYILGLSAFYHDSSATLLKDGRIVAAAQEERFSRLKHDPSFPRRAIAWCLEEAGIRPADIALVVFYEKPLAKLDRVLETTSAVAPAGRKRFADSLPRWFVDKLRVEDIALDHLEGFSGEFAYARHHEAHAASAFLASPFREAAVLTTDGVGEWTTNSIAHGQDATVRQLKQIRFPHSLGLLYSAFTQYLGFEVNEGEYKVMGLAPYGEPRFVDAIRQHMIDLRDDGSYRLRMEAFDFLANESTISDRFAEVFGAPPRDPKEPVTALHMDVARSVQRVTEEVLLAQARHAHALTGARNLCLAGGVALNCVANGRILREGPFDDLWIQPAAGDAGGSLGAALVGWHHVKGGARAEGPGDIMQGGYLGPAYDDDAVTAALEAHGLTGARLDDEAMARQVSALLVDGKVVGWFQGRMEFGPRALGSRSILADPRVADMQRRVNAKIKFREGFRPFAPVVLADHVSTYFDLDRPSPYMLLVTQVAEGQRVPLTDEEAALEGFEKLKARRSTLPAITHVDGSARIQTVDGVHNPLFHRLLSVTLETSGSPVLMNTSFNLKGEPVVCNPYDACRTFLASGMDALAIGPFLVIRPADATPTGRVDPPVPEVVERTTSDLRTFGVGGAAILTVLGALQLWMEHTTVAAVAMTLAVLFGVPGLLMPELLRGVERVMGRVGKVIGHFNARILLSVLFLAVVTPIGWIRRLGNPDPLKTALDPNAGSYWLDPEPDQVDAPKGYGRMF